MLGFILLCLIVVYEVYRITYMKDYFKLTTMIRGVEGKSKGDKEYDYFQSVLKQNKRYASYIALEYFYIFILAVLIFTQYWLVTLVLTALGWIVYGMKKNDNNISINYLDSITTIAIIILAVAML